MRVGREEALDLFRKWLAEGTPLRINFGCPVFSAAFRGRVSRVSTIEVGALSDDRLAELALRVTPELEFAYGDSRGTPDAGAFEGALVIFLRTSEEGEEPDFIAFSEIVAP